jgi:hypothetical protein
MADIDRSHDGVGSNVSNDETSSLRAAQDPRGDEAAHPLT